MGSSPSSFFTLSRRICVSVVVLLACCCRLLQFARGAAAAFLVPALYVFGDSQADVGNNNYLPASLAKANFPHYGIDYLGGEATGRFSNGYNFVDFLAGSLGVATPPAYLSISNTSSNNSIYVGGVNFASGGAGVSNLTNMGECISFDEQIERHYSKVHTSLVQQLGQPKALVHLAKSVFAVAIGSNDILHRVLLNPTCQQAIQDQFISSLAQSLTSQLQRMYELGMRRLLLVGAAPLGCCPLLRERSPNKEECHVEANHLSARYNSAAAALLRDMSTAHPDMSYAFFDTYVALLRYIRHPKAHGYTEVKAACCGLGHNNVMFFCSPTSTYCTNRTSHIFWDFVHTTEITAQKLTKVAFDGSAPLVSPINIRHLTST